MKTKLILAALVSVFATGALAQPASQEGFEFSGYWRAGFNTGPSLLQRPGDAAGQGGVGTSHITRHIRNPNYFRFTLGRKFTNGMRVEAGLDSPDEKNLPHADGVWKPDSLRVRDLFLELPIDETTKLWAGSRRYEPEDVRLLDFFPFGMNPFGGGVDAEWGQAFVSVTDDAFDFKTLDKQSKRKTIAGLLRANIKLDENSALKPTLIVTTRGKDPEHTVTDPDLSSVQPSPAPAATEVTVAEKKPSTDVKLGAVYSYWGADHWANNFLVLSREAQTNADGDIEHNMKYALYQSGSFGLGDDAAILTALSLEMMTFASERQQFKVIDSVIDEDGDKTTKSKTTLSVATQPVYFVTDRFHVALDLNVVQHFNRVTASDANAVFVTPIVRYAMNKNAMGTPQIYTSMTYGSYDAKIKSKFDSDDMQKNMITTQTGFEVFF